MSNAISPEQQREIIGRLYRSGDSISSVKKFNAAYGDKIGRLGRTSMTANAFYRKMKQTDFIHHRVKSATKDIAGKDIHLN